MIILTVFGRWVQLIDTLNMQLLFRFLFSFKNMQVVKSLILVQWLEACDRDILTLIQLLKFNANDDDLANYRRLVRQILPELFSSKFLIIQYIITYTYIKFFF